jgi:hypothetical protein
MNLVTFDDIHFINFCKAYFVHLICTIHVLHFYNVLVLFLVGFHKTTTEHLLHARPKLSSMEDMQILSGLREQLLLLFTEEMWLSVIR